MDMTWGKEIERSWLHVLGSIIAQICVRLVSQTLTKVRVKGMTQKDPSPHQSL